MLPCCEASSVYNTRVMLPSAKKDSIPATQESCVLYEYPCGCAARYVVCTSQRLAHIMKQHVSTSIRTKYVVIREQPARMFESANSNMKSDSAIRQHLITIPKCDKTYTDDKFLIIEQARSSFELSVLESVYIRIQRQVLCNQKQFIFSLGPFK